MSSAYDRPANRFPVFGCLFSLLLLACSLGLLIWWFWPRTQNGLNPNAQPRPVMVRGDLSELEKANIAIYEQVAPSVVHVTNLAESRGAFNLNIQRIPRGTGSGFIWDTDGHIVTNYHVVEGADAVRVMMGDHTAFDANPVWAYPEKDIAVLTINAPKNKLHPIPIGTSNDLKVGQITYAIGNPFGLDQSMTNGIVSALGREVESEGHRAIQGAIQTSAPINPGNSGGPLLDSAGRLIGMNTAILSPSGASAGIGFAIPVDEINEIVPQLIRHGKVVRPRLGVQVASDQLARQVGVDSGALILKVVPDSPADKAGLLGTRRGQSGRIVLGDVIVAIDGKEIKKSTELTADLEKHKVGDTVTLTVLRDGDRKDFKVTLQSLD